MSASHAKVAMSKMDDNYAHTTTANADHNHACQAARRSGGVSMEDNDRRQSTASNG